MPVTDDDRRHLFEMFRQQLDERAANTVMELLPHAGWSDLARRADLEATENRLLAEMYRRFGEIDRRFGEIDRRFGEIDRRFGEIEGRFGEVEGRLGEMDGRLSRQLGELHRRISTLIAANAVTLVGVIAATRL